MQLEGCIGFQLAAMQEGEDGPAFQANWRFWETLRVIRIRKGVRVMGRVEEFQSVLRTRSFWFGWGSGRPEYQNTSILVCLCEKQSHFLIVLIVDSISLLNSKLLWIPGKEVFYRKSAVCWCFLSLHKSCELFHKSHGCLCRVQLHCTVDTSG